MDADTKRGADRIICLIDEGDEFHVSLSSLRDELALHGLHVVTAAEKAVLDAMAKVPRGYIESWIRASAAPTCQAALHAELARREAAK